MRPLSLLVIALLVTFLVSSSLTLAEEKKAEICVMATDKNAKAVQGATVEVVGGGEKRSYTTDAAGKSCFQVKGVLCESITVTRDGCSEKLAPVGVLDGMTVIITLHCWPAK